jgi:hypothetical protein
MREAHEKWNLTGLMESHHFGFYPSIISKLSKMSFLKPWDDMEKLLKTILIGEYGESAADDVDKALRLWSEAITHYVATDADQYGAFRIGPAFPLWTSTKGKKMPLSKQAAFGNAIFDERYKPRYTRATYSTHSMRMYSSLENAQKMRDLLFEGVQLLKTVKNPCDELLKLTNLGEYMYRTTVTAINVTKQFIVLRKFEIEPSKQECIKLVDSLEQILFEEKENVQKTIPLVQFDSTLGYEPSMEYAGDEKALLWKLDQIDYDLDVTLKKYKEQLKR